MSLYTRRVPWPFHVRISGVGFMIGSPGPNKPAMVSTKAQDVAQVAPPDFSYSGANPLNDREQPYESLALGMGMSLQDKWQDMRYHSARAVDCSVHPWIKGPEITLFTPASRDATVGVTKFFELGSSLYCANGRFILRRASDGAWNLVKDFGVGAAVLDVAVFAADGDKIERAFVGLSNQPAQWSADGTAWTAFPTFHSYAFAVIGREFWWADAINRLRKLDTNADPTNEANYTSLIFNAGDASSFITALMVTAGGTLVIAKTDGLYTLDGAGDDRELFPFLKFAPLDTNGKAWGQYENDLYSSYGNQLGKIGPNLGWTPVGPEKLVNNLSAVRGRITAFTGVETMFALAGMYDRDTQTGHLMKFGAWVSPGQDSAPSTHIDAWHGAISEPFTNRAIQTIFVSSVGAPAGHTRAYLGFSDGTVGWLINPCSPNPVSCTDYRYHVGDGWVDLPTWHGTYHASRKSVRHFSVTGTNLNPQNYVTIQYRMDPTSGPGLVWTTFENIFDSSVYEQAALPMGTFGTLAAFRVHLHNTINTGSPMVSAFAVGHALRPARIMQFECDILCADGLVRRDGVPLRMGRKAIRELIEEAVDTPGAVNVILPDETFQRLSITDYAVSQAFDEVGRQWRGSLKIKAVQWSTDSTT